MAASMAFSEIQGRRVARAALFGGWILMVLLAVAHKGDPEEGQQENDKQNNAVRVEMRNVTYHFTDQAAVQIAALSGELVPVEGQEMPVFDDKNSFALRIGSAKMAMSLAAMADVLNTFVFAGKDAPLKDISLGVEKNRLKVKGKLHSKGDIPFESQGTLNTTPDGKMRLHDEKIKALHVPVKGLLDLFGVDIADLIKTGKVPGVQAEKDDLILDLEKILPPPRMQGKLTAVRLEGGNLVAVFGAEKRDGAGQKATAGNYMAYKGNRLRFGKLTMTDADLTLMDMDPRDPFDFFLDRYKDQLVAGYSKITPSFGLRVFLKDLNKLGRN